MSNTPFVKTIRRPAARASRTNAPSASASSIRERHVAREAPLVARAIYADVLRARLHAERLEQPVVVVWIAVELVDRDVELVGAFDEIERRDRERRLGVAAQTLGNELGDRRVRAVAADTFGVEDADADDEVVDGKRRAHADPHVHRIAGGEHGAPLAVAR